jgi:N-acetylglucosamine kinase-like BadF-type ATPase
VGVTNTPPDAIVIAVDGGGSKTDGVALDLTGTVVARARKRGSSIQVEHLDRSVRVVDSVISELRAATGNRPLLQTNIYLSGLDLPVEVSAFASAVANEQWAVGATGNRVIVDNDLFALLRSGTEERDAVAVVCGTGINCIGIRADGRHARFTAWGTISGDWGGGWFLGEQALWHAARAMDGRGDPTSLTVSVPAHLGLPDVQAVIEAFHFGRISTDRFSTMAPLVMEAADAGDAVAGSILDRQAEEIVALAVAALKRLDLLDQAVPVVLGGGVLASGNTRLLSGIEAGLAERAPHSRAQLVRSRPILGAALLTLETVGAPPAALDATRAALEYSPPSDTPSQGVSVLEGPGYLR